jgi:hypothetical protein
MTQQLCALTERVQRSLVRAAAAVRAAFGATMTNAQDIVWNVMPSVPTPAICTHGKRYEWRLQEMHT